MKLHKKRKKAKILKALECGSTRLAERLVTWYNFILQLVLESGSNTTYLLAHRTAYFSYLTLLSSSFLRYSFRLTLPCSLLPFCWDKFILNSVPSFFGRKYSKTFPNCVLVKLQSHLIENILSHFQIVSQLNSNRISSKKFQDNSKLCLCQYSLFLLIYSILLPSESKLCPLTLASVLACADSVDELRF